MDDLIARIEEKYGDFGLILLITNFVVVFAAWLVLSIMYIWPFLAPIALAAWLLWSVKK